MIMVNYTVDAVRASEIIRLWPMLLRPIVAPFLESYRKIRRELDAAKNIINPILEERRREKETALGLAEPIPYNNDAMDWKEQTVQGRPYDPVAMQLTLSVVAIHTTSDMTTQVILDLAEERSLFKSYEMRLYRSFLKRDGKTRLSINFS
jgi:hypothetical protein